LDSRWLFAVAQGTSMLGGVLGMAVVLLSYLLGSR
jgi:hypothetical protein